MNIAIIGYGKMGKEIEQAAKQRGLAVKAIIDPLAPGAPAKEISAKSMKGVDVAIEFTQPGAAIENIRKLAELKINIVVGTTGWYDSMKQAMKIAEDSGIGLIWASNFSLGVNAFFRIVTSAAKVMDKLDDFDAFVHEFHHSQKADSPSGTALTAANILLDNIKRKKELLTETAHAKIRPEQLHLTSTRTGNIPGTHMVGFDSADSTIEIRHTARNRSGFALGAVMAAEWISGKKGFYSIDAMMDDLIR